MKNALDMNPEEPFTSFFAGLEVFPILDLEATKITGISQKLLMRYERVGLVSRSVVNEQRPISAIKNFNFYDIFRLEIIRRLYLKTFVGEALLEELLDDLLDTFALEIDQILSYRQRCTNHEIGGLVAVQFMERESEWRQFWLLDGERLDPLRAAQMCVGIWLATFDASAQVICDFKACCRIIPSHV